MSLTNLFRSKEADLLEAALKKRQAGYEARDAAQRDVDDLAPELASNDDVPQLAPALERLRRATEMLPVYERMVEQAQAAEQRRKDRLRGEQQQRDYRALSQFVGQEKRLAQQFETAVADAFAAFHGMREVGEKIRKLLPPGATDGLAVHVNYRALLRACETEMNRQGVEVPGVSGTPGAPGTRYEIGFQPKNTPRLSEYLNTRLTACLRTLTGQASPPPAPAVAEPPPAPETPKPDMSVLAPSEWVRLHASREPAPERSVFDIGPGSVF